MKSAAVKNGDTQFAQFLNTFTHNIDTVIS